MVDEVPDSRRPAAPVLDIPGRPGDRRRDRVLAGRLHGAGQGESARRVAHRLSAHHSDVSGRIQAHAPLGDGARLVQHDRVQGAGGFQDFGPLDDDAELGGAPRAHEQGRRCGQAQRARAGDDEYGDGRHEGVLCRVAQGQPGDEGRRGDDEHGGHEYARDAVGQTLNRGLAGLSGGDHGPDAGQGRGLADGGGAHQQRTGGVDGGAGDGIADPDLDGHRFAGEHGGVHGGAALDDHAVGSDLLPGAHGQQVACPQLVDRDALLGADGVRAGDAVVVEDVDGVGRARRRGQAHPHGLLRAELEQGAQGVAGAVFGAGLGVAPGQKEGGDPGGRFEIHVRGVALVTRHELHGHPHADVPGPAPDERPQAPCGRGDDAQRYEGIHGEGAMAQGPEGGLVEGPGSPGRHGQGHGRHQPLPAGQLEGRDHGDRHDGDGQDQADDEAAAQVGGPGRL